MAESEPAGEPQTAARPDWVLVGTVVASDPHWSRASITGPDGKTRLYRVGDRLGAGARVVAIGDDWAVIQEPAGRRRLTLADRAAGGAQPAGQPAEPPAESAPAGQPAGPSAPPDGAEDRAPDPIHGLEQVRPGIYRIRRDDLQKRLADPNGLLQGATATLVFDADGQVDGLRLGLWGQDPIFGRLGFEDGDVIRRIGPLAIDSPVSLQGLPALLGRAREVEVEVLRAGQRRRLRYWFDDR